MDITLPGKKNAQIKIEAFTGESNNEVALASLISGDLPKLDDPAVYSKFYIQESKSN